MDTLALTDSWDLAVNSQNNIAVITGPLAVAQNVATVCRTFQGEDYYDTTLGIPYRTQVLGMGSQLTLLNYLLEQAALTVPDVTSAKADITVDANREAHGTLNLIDSLVTF